MAYTGEIADLYVILRAVTEPFKKAMDEAAVSGEASGSRMSGGLSKVSPVILGIAGAATLAIGMSVKWASDFQTQYTRLYTAAGASKQAVMENRQAMLDLGTATGYTGTQIAQALYLPVSAGFKLTDALKLVGFAAQEARISGASLNDTAYSLSSVMKAFGLDATKAGQTMGLLNAIVGDGAMTFQDFNSSIKNWAPTAATMGVSIQSMGAALAYLTDRGNNAEEASTRLTMGLTMMAYPTKQAAGLLEGLGVASSDVNASSQTMADALKKAGVTQNQLAADLKKPDGLYVALSHLQSALKAAGDSGTEADATISKIFGGGRSDKAILSLLGNLNGLQQKFNQISKDASGKQFANDWAAAQATTAVQFDKLKATVINLGIAFGEKLLPYVTLAMGYLNTGIQYILKHREAMIALAAVVGSTMVVAFGHFAQMLITVSKGLVANPWAAAIMVLVVGAVEIVTHWQAVKKFFEGLWSWMYAHKDILILALHLFFPELALFLDALFLIISHWQAIWHFMVRLGLDFVQWGKDIAKFFSHMWDDLVVWFRIGWGAALAAGNAIWSAMKTAWHETVKFFETIWNATGGKLVHLIATEWNQVSAAVAKEWHHIVADLTSIWQSLVTIWNATGGKLVHVIDEGISYLVGIFMAHWGTIENILSQAWGFITDVTSAALDVIGGLINAAWDFAWGRTKMAWDVIYGVIKTAWEIIWGVIKLVLDIIVGIIKGAWDLITGVIKAAWDLITGIINGALDFIKDLLKIFADIFTGQWSKLWGDMGRLLSDAWNNIWSIIKGTFGGLIVALYNFGKDIIQGLINGIIALAKAAASAAGTIWDTIKAVFKDAIKMLYQVGKDIVQGLMNGILDMIPGLQSVTTSVAGTAEKAVRDALKSKSPSMVFHQIGQDVGQGLINGIASRRGDVRDAMLGLSGAMVDVGFSGQGSFGLSPNVTAEGAYAPGIVNIYIEGSVLTEKDLRDVIQTQMLQLGARYSTSYTSYKR